MVGLEDWPQWTKVIGKGVLTYLCLILMVRISGKRTLSKWNAFDFVVTVALGSLLATITLSSDVRLESGLTAIALLLSLQFSITWLQVRSRRVLRLVKARPTLLLDRGQFLLEAMKAQRVAESDVLSAIRGSGIASVESVEAVVLETDGSLSVMKSSPDASRSALSDVR